MPIYEYRCASCGAELEKLQKISDPALVECPECGQGTLVKLISASSFRLKGSGWYETDFKTGNRKNGAGEAEAAGGAAAPESAKDTVGNDKGNNSSKTSKDGASASKDVGSESKAESKAESKTESKPKPEVKSGSDGAGKTSKPAAKD